PSCRSRPYNIRVVCYLREYLEFACSSYSQDVQVSGRTHNLARYCSKHFRRPLSLFVRLWQRFADEAIFLHYHRAKLRNGDVVEDFFQRVGEMPSRPHARPDANPSISGNLLAFKLLLNRRKCHSPELYRTFSELARLDPRYR